MNACHIALYCSYIVFIWFFRFFYLFLFIQKNWVFGVVFFVLYYPCCIFCVVYSCCMRVAIFVLSFPCYIFLVVWYFCNLTFSCSFFLIYVASRSHYNIFSSSFLKLFMIHSNFLVLLLYKIVVSIIWIYVPPFLSFPLQLK